jgi:dienelactone hydrolase
MSPGYETALSEYDTCEFTAAPWTRTVYRRGSGPAVIIIHEIPGLHPLVVRYANRVAEAGMTVFLPSLFGEPGRPVTLGYSLRSLAETICIRREFHVWSTGKSSPIVAVASAGAQMSRGLWRPGSGCSRDVFHGWICIGDDD